MSLRLLLAHCIVRFQTIYSVRRPYGDFSIGVLWRAKEKRNCSWRIGSADTLRREVLEFSALGSDGATSRSELVGQLRVSRIRYASVVIFYSALRLFHHDYRSV